MRKCNASVEAGAAEAFTLYQVVKNFFPTNIGDRADQEFAEDFETVFLAARMGVAQNVVWLDEVVENHCSGLAGDGPRDGLAARACSR